MHSNEPETIVPCENNLWNQENLLALFLEVEEVGKGEGKLAWSAITATQPTWYPATIIYLT